MIVLSVDIGIHHLGLSMTSLKEDFTFSEIKSIDLVDITVFRHKNVSFDDCTLGHTKTYTDWINHLIQEYQSTFETADIILIERQPPNGFNAIEQLLFSAYREKSHLIHPRKVHTYLGIGSFDYEKRKEYTVKASLKYLSDDMICLMEKMERSHDIADSICMMLYWSAKKHKDWKCEKNKEESDHKFKDVFKMLDSFRYIKGDKEMRR